jgi:hypothetical protein
LSNKNLVKKDNTDTVLWHLMEFFFIKKQKETEQNDSNNLNKKIRFKKVPNIKTSTSGMVTLNCD